MEANHLFIEYQTIMLVYKEIKEFVFWDSI